MRGFRPLALQIVNYEYKMYLRDSEDETHLDTTEEHLAMAWSGYSLKENKNTRISDWIADRERELSGCKQHCFLRKTKGLEAILKSSLLNLTDVFLSDKMDLPLSDLYYPSESSDQVDYA